MVSASSNRASQSQKVEEAGGDAAESRLPDGAAVPSTSGQQQDDDALVVPQQDAPGEPAEETSLWEDPAAFEDPSAFVDVCSPSRPSDEAILLQQNGIRTEVQAPYVGDKEPLSVLKQEYEQHQGSSDVFVHKISQMEGKGYMSLRRTAPDGNCFFRGFIFGYLENMLVHGDIKERESLVALLKGWDAKLQEQGYQQLVFEDAQQMLTDQLDRLARPHFPLTQADLEKMYRDDQHSNMVVMYLRMITGAEIKRRQEFFMPFILGTYDDSFLTIETFLQRHVENMGEESDHIHIVAISEALQVPIRVVYLDRSGADFGGGGSDSEINTHDFLPEGMPASTPPRVTLLYRPGHFDVVYMAPGHTA